MSIQNSLSRFIALLLSAGLLSDPLLAVSLRGSFEPCAVPQITGASYFAQEALIPRRGPYPHNPLTQNLTAWVYAVASKSWHGRLLGIAWDAFYNNPGGEERYRNAMDHGEFEALSEYDYPGLFHIAIQGPEKAGELIKGLTQDVASEEEAHECFWPLINEAIDTANKNPLTVVEALTWVREKLNPAIVHWADGHEELFVKGSHKRIRASRSLRKQLVDMMRAWTADLRIALFLHLQGKGSALDLFKAYWTLIQLHAEYNAALKTGGIYSTVAPRRRSWTGKAAAWLGGILIILVLSTAVLISSGLPQGAGRPAPLHAQTPSAGAPATAGPDVRTLELGHSERPQSFILSAQNIPKDFFNAGPATLTITPTHASEDFKTFEIRLWAWPEFMPGGNTTDPHHQPFVRIRAQRTEDGTWTWVDSKTANLESQSFRDVALISGDGESVHVEISLSALEKAFTTCPDFARFSLYVETGKFLLISPKNPTEKVSMRPLQKPADLNERKVPATATLSAPKAKKPVTNQPVGDKQLQMSA